jgi:hypothetical protein
MILFQSLRMISNYGIEFILFLNLFKFLQILQVWIWIELELNKSERKNIKI